MILTTIKHQYWIIIIYNAVQNVLVVLDGTGLHYHVKIANQTKYSITLFRTVSNAHRTAHHALSIKIPIQSSVIAVVQKACSTLQHICAVSCATRPSFSIGT